MSKKIKIPSLNIRNNLSMLFHSFMANRPKPRYRQPCYEDMDDEELMWLMQQQGYVFNDLDDEYMDYYDDDDGDVIWPPKHIKSKSKKNKKRSAYDDFWDNYEHKSKHKHSKSKKARLIDINQPYSGEEEDPNEVGYTPYEEVSDDDGIVNGKEIYYYPDYHDKNSRLEFSTLNAFNEFCMDNGFSVPEHVANEIMYRRISHTCLRPDAKVYGLYEIVAEESYGVMVYEVCEPSELGNL